MQTSKDVTHMGTNHAYQEPCKIINKFLRYQPNRAPYHDILTNKHNLSVSTPRTLARIRAPHPRLPTT